MDNLICKSVQDRHDWIDLIVTELLPFSFCKKEKVRKYVKMNSICTVSLKKSMLTLRDKVTEKIKFELPNIFALVIDGWENPNGDHIVAIFASYEIYKDGLYISKRPLLSVSTLNTPTTENSKSHADYISWVLCEFGKSPANVVSITADNCNLNPATCNLLNIKMVGCKSHLLNLFIRKYFLDKEQLFTKVHQLMLLFKNKRKYSTLLSQLTPLKAKIRNVTRWSSTYRMMER